MNIYYGCRSSRPTRLFSLGLLDVPLWVRLRRLRLREAAAAFGLCTLVTTFTNNPGFPPCR